LLDMAAHLLVELLLQILGARHHMLAPGVLCLQIREHLGTLLLPQPCIIVDQRVAVDGLLHMPPRRNRRLHRSLFASRAHCPSHVRGNFESNSTDAPRHTAHGAVPTATLCCPQAIADSLYFYFTAWSSIEYRLLKSVICL